MKDDLQKHWMRKTMNHNTSTGMHMEHHASFSSSTFFSFPHPGCSLSDIFVRWRIKIQDCHHFFFFLSFCYFFFFFFSCLLVLISIYGIVAYTDCYHSKVFSVYSRIHLEWWQRSQNTSSNHRLIRTALYVLLQEPIYQYRLSLSYLVSIFLCLHISVYFCGCLYVSKTTCQNLCHWMNNENCPRWK